MRLKSSILAVLAALALSSPVLAVPPDSLRAIPLYPGLARDAAAEDYARELQSSDGDPDLIEEALIAYSTNAAAEEVFAWYRDKLAARPAREISPAEYESGAIPPLYILEPYDEEDFRNGSTGDRVIVTKYEGAWIKEQLKARRKPLKEGYVASGSITWMRRRADGSEASLSVMVLDGSFLAYIGEGPGASSATTGKKNYVQKTYLFFYSELRRSVEESEAAAEEERDGDSEEDYARARARLAANPPTERELGLPLYPGARFDLDSSAGMSMNEGMQAWLFLSKDSLEKILAFYEKALGKQAERLGDATRIVLKGAGFFPAHFVAFEAVPGGGTRISVFKLAE